MLKYLYPDIKWDAIKVVGFDMDGTLYDEFEFIVQVYVPIAELLAKTANGNKTGIYSWMIERWLEKGSSYNYIFEEVLINHGVEETARNRIIPECVDMLRSFKPTLVLTSRVKIMLDFFKRNFDIFLITDGSGSLQKAKIKTLKLHSWFKPENIGISGCFGKQYQKPITLILGEIGIFKNTVVEPQEVVYFGDRQIDRQFAANAGFQFVLVRCMW